MNMLQTLDRLMKEKGLNRSRLAQKSGVPYTTIDGLYKKGFENVKLSTLLKLSRTLGVTLDELAGEEAPLGKERLDHEDLAVARDYHALDGHGKRLVRLVLDEEKSRLGTSAEEEPQEEIIQIKHYLVPAAAGYASPIEGEDYENIPLPHGAPANADFCLTIQGDSMEPYIHDGDLAFVKRDAPIGALTIPERSICFLPTLTERTPIEASRKTAGPPLSALERCCWTSGFLSRSTGDQVGRFRQISSCSQPRASLRLPRLSIRPSSTASGPSRTLPTSLANSSVSFMRRR